jgi:hypothetical protein
LSDYYIVLTVFAGGAGAWGAVEAGGVGCFWPQPGANAATQSTNAKPKN